MNFVLLLERKSSKFIRNNRIIIGMPVSPHGWKSIKEILVSKNQTELLNLIHDLYLLNPDNTKFIQTRFAIRRINNLYLNHIGKS